jgi:hypothetical protein
MNIFFFQRKQKAVQQHRTPKRGRDFERTFLACVLECGGAPPLFITTVGLLHLKQSSNGGLLNRSCH